MLNRWNVRENVFGRNPGDVQAGMKSYLDQMLADMDVQVVRMQRMIHASPANTQFPSILRRLLDARQAVFDEKLRLEQEN